MDEYTNEAANTEFAGENASEIGHSEPETVSEAISEGEDTSQDELASENASSDLPTVER